MLTTNHVGSFDEAFRSRIYVSLYYPKLGKDETSEISEMNLRRSKEAKDVDIEIDAAGIQRFYKKTLEGQREEDIATLEWTTGQKCIPNGSCSGKLGL